MKREFFIVATWEQNGCDCREFNTFTMSTKEAVGMARQLVRFYGSYCEYSFVSVTVYDDCENIVFEA